jgi:8-oxo-dGTP diphosphatase
MDVFTCTAPDGWKAALRHAVVDGIVTQNGQILLVRRSTSSHSEPGKWALPGGYVDINETTLQAAAREILEETGWQVSDLKLFALIDSPKRRHDPRQNISFVYYGTEAVKVQKPDNEIDEVDWFLLDKLPPESQIAFDHADIIKLYQRYLIEKFSLPIF